MHHCQIDRLFAIWQKINPTSWFPTDAREIRSISNAYFNPKEPLMPFRSVKNGEVGTLGDNGWWTCDTSRSTNTFGYSYADTDVADPMQNFNQKYGWSIRWNQGDQFGQCPAEMLPYKTTDAQIFQFGQADLDPSRPSIMKSVVQAAESIMPSGLLSGNVFAQAAPEEPKQAVLTPESQAATRTIKSQTTDGTLEAPKSEVDESAVSRSWYIDMEVERYESRNWSRSIKLTVILDLLSMVASSSITSPVPLAPIPRSLQSRKSWQAQRTSLQRLFRHVTIVAAT